VLQPQPSALCLADGIVGVRRLEAAGRIPLNGRAPELEQTAVLLAVEPQRVRVYRRPGELGRGRLKAE
jgi:hypothetical protein